MDRARQARADANAEAFRRLNESDPVLDDVRPAIEESDDDVLRVPGDPAVVQATTEFLEAWFVRRDLAAALAYVRPSGCCRSDFVSQLSPSWKCPRIRQNQRSAPDSRSANSSPPSAG